MQLYVKNDMRDVFGGWIGFHWLIITLGPTELGQRERMFLFTFKVTISKGFKIYMNKLQAFSCGRGAKKLTLTPKSAQKAKHRILRPPCEKWR